MKYLILFLQILFIKCFHRKYLIYPFIQNKYDNLEEIHEIISELSSLEYYTNITIAEPPQTIRSFIDFTKFHFYISNVSSNREYILENSNSFNTKYDHEFILYTYSFVSGKYANETLTVDLKNINSSFSNEIIKVKNFTFSMPSTISILNRKMFPSSIGLGFYAYNSNTKLNFLIQLNEKGILNNSYFFFDFKDDFSGKLYLGVLPHDIYPKKYSEDNFYKLYTNIDNVLAEWSFKGLLTYNYNKEENNYSIYKNKVKVVLDLNLNGLIMDYIYFNVFNRTFFHEYLKNDICKIKHKDYYYIYCEKDKIDITKFKTIYYYQKDFNYTFSFDYNDLFITKKNYIIFNIFFEDNGFTLLIYGGKIFLRKYLFAFNYEQKMIGFYLESREEKGLIPENKNNSSEILLIFLLIFIFLLFLFLIILLLKYCCGNKGRKIRKNELDDSYDYSIQKNDD